MTRREPINRAQRDLIRPPRDRYATRTQTFESDGADCSGTLYLPASAADPPVVVMGPDVGADRTFGLPAVAERFAAAGYAAFLFDYRGFGDSDGTDRRVDPPGQRADYAAAADRVARIDAVGETVLYGVGLSAAHALWLASERDDVAAAMAVTPILDGRAFLRRRGTKAFLRAALAGVRDATIGRVLGGREVPIVGDPDDLSLVTGPGAERAYLDLVDRESTWSNRTPARSLVGVARYRLGDRIDGVDVPTLLLAGDADEQAPPAAVEEAAERVPRSTFVRMPADHWSVYGEDFEPAVGYQRSFLADAFDD